MTTADVEERLAAGPGAGAAVAVTEVGRQNKEVGTARKVCVGRFEEAEAVRRRHACVPRRGSRRRRRIEEPSTALWRRRLIDREELERENDCGGCTLCVWVSRNLERVQIIEPGACRGRPVILRRDVVAKWRGGGREATVDER